MSDILGKDKLYLPVDEIISGYYKV